MLFRVLTVLTITAAAYGQSAGKYYENDQWGFKVRFPSDWKQAALSADEEWIVAKFTDTNYLWSKKTDNAGFSTGGYPIQWVIGFPHARQEDRGAKVTKDGEKTIVTFKNPYKDYKDFVKRERWFVGGGYYFKEEEETTYKDMKVTKYEIAVEKMVSAPYRIVTWVFHFDDIDFAVQFKILEDYYKKHRATFANCLKSFRRIEKKRAMNTATTTGNKIITSEDEKKMTPEERARARQDRFEKTLRKETEALPKTWYVKRSEHYVVLANCSKKFAGEVIKHAEAIRDYLDKAFGDVGSGYIPPGIIRIFETGAEETAFHQSTSTNWFSSSQQVTLNEQSKKDGLKTWAMESVSSEITDQWLGFKNRLLDENLPWWFRNGLKQHMKFARVKGRSVKIKPDEYDRESIKREITKGTAVPVRELFEKGDENQNALWGMQAGSVVTYMLAAGNRGKTKDLIPNYMNNLIVAIKEAQAEFKKKADALKKEVEEKAEEKKPAGESEDESGEDEDDDKTWEKFRDAIRARAKAIRKTAFDKTFGELSDKDWEKLDRAWRNYAG